ncbi:MAG: hypothetical protein IT158_28790 [Bryobacterales bacterium]|nr:hypothetical protein [Bryobacterales bacterium]
MSIRFALCPLVLGAAAIAAAQDYYPRHNFTFGAGAAIPGGPSVAIQPDQPLPRDAPIKEFMDTSPMIAIGYGYRFHRYFQADIGLNIGFGAANVRDFLDTSLGTVEIGDREYMLPMGGRAIAPLFGGRLLFAGGGGGAYLRYNERIRQPSDYFRVDCPVCTRRSGWGYYALANGSYFLDSNQHFRIGVTAQFVRGHTEGEAVGNIPGTRTTDHWTNILGEFGFSF